MSREEAIHYLERIKQEYDCSYEEDALDMAIKALEREQKFLDAGYKNGRVEFMIGGRKFMVKEMAQ